MLCVYVTTGEFRFRTGVDSRLVFVVSLSVEKYWFGGVVMKQNGTEHNSLYIENRGYLLAISDMIRIIKSRNYSDTDILYRDDVVWLVSELMDIARMRVLS